MAFPNPKGWQRVPEGTRNDSLRSAAEKESIR